MADALAGVTVLNSNHRKVVFLFYRNSHENGEIGVVLSAEPVWIPILSVDSLRNSGQLTEHYVAAY